MHLLVVGISHKTSQLVALERYADGTAIPRPAGLEEYFILTTCNRVELYGTSRNPDRDVAEIKSNLQDANTWYAHTGKCALIHLFRVASSLDAMVVGETQVMGQLKAAHFSALEKGTTAQVLDRAVNHALYVSKRIRSETDLGRRPVSIASVAVDSIKQHVGALGDKRCLIIGSGEIGALVAKQLVGRGLSDIVIVNRTFEHAQALAEHAGGMALPWEDRNQALIASDIAIVCTATDGHVITEAAVRNALVKRNNTPISIIDLAVPRAVEPSTTHLEGIRLTTIDSLKQLAAENLKNRLNEVGTAEKIIGEEVRQFSMELCRT